jgi:hypothetical protein
MIIGSFSKFKVVRLVSRPEYFSVKNLNEHCWSQVSTEAKSRRTLSFRMRVLIPDPSEHIFHTHPFDETGHAGISGCQREDPVTGKRNEQARRGRGYMDSPKHS